MGPASTLLQNPSARDLIQVSALSTASILAFHDSGGAFLHVRMCPRHLSWSSSLASLKPLSAGAAGVLGAGESGGQSASGHCHSEPPPSQHKRLVLRPNHHPAEASGPQVGHVS